MSLYGAVARSQVDAYPRQSCTSITDIRAYLIQPFSSFVRSLCNAESGARGVGAWKERFSWVGFSLFWYACNPAGGAVMPRSSRPQAAQQGSTRVYITVGRSTSASAQPSFQNFEEAKKKMGTTGVACVKLSMPRPHIPLLRPEDGQPSAVLLKDSR